MLQHFDTLDELTAAFPDEQTCVEHFRAIRWAHGAFCPYCGSTRIYHFADRRAHKCGDCRQRFSIKVGTIFEDTKLPLRKWFIAIWLITSHKKGIASTQLAKDLGITQKSAWFVLHRLREASKTGSFNRQLTGIVEADETFVGGKAKNRHKNKRGGSGRGGLGSGKVPVVGAVERGGEVFARATKSVDAATLKGFVRTVVAPEVTMLVTDEWVGYRGLDREYPHRVVRHTAGEYVSPGGVHTQSIEGFWSLLKRQIYGIHHWVSEKHLDRYVSEATWRYNRRDAEEGGRVNSLLASTNGKRLRYRDLIEK
ncbi:MAG TPA: IS1595 family transposase [Stellaceae bacterium]|jgi:transposase-like protein